MILLRKISNTVLEFKWGIVLLSILLWYPEFEIFRDYSTCESSTVSVCLSVQNIAKKMRTICILNVSDKMALIILP
jgi:hypothetical protein